jgi:hypothetical protein
MGNMTPIKSVNVSDTPASVIEVAVLHEVAWFPISKVDHYSHDLAGICGIKFFQFINV